MRIVIAISLVAISALPGCTQNQKLLGRYDNANCLDESFADKGPIQCSSVIPTIKTAVVLEPKAPDKASDRSGRVFPERALASYIEAMQRYSKSASALRDNLAAPIENASERGLFADASNFAGTLTFTAAYVGDFNPADRIERLRMTLILDGGSIKSWTGARTAFTEIKPGQIISTGKVTLSASADIKPPSSPVSGSLSASSERSRSETLDVTARIEDITPIIDPPNGIVIVRRGGFGLDLTGNAQVDVTLTPTSRNSSVTSLFSISGYSKSSAPTSPELLKVSATTTRIASGAIRGHVLTDYVVRHIRSGDATSEDGDDAVTFITRHAKSESIELVPARTKTWGLKSLLPFEVGPVFLAIRKADGGLANLCFEKPDQAEELLDYLGNLRSFPSRIGRFGIGLSYAGQLEPIRGQLAVSPGCVADAASNG